MNWQDLVKLHYTFPELLLLDNIDASLFIISIGTHLLCVFLRCYCSMDGIYISTHAPINNYAHLSPLEERYVLQMLHHTPIRPPQQSNATDRVIVTFMTALGTVQRCRCAHISLQQPTWSLCDDSKSGPPRCWRGLRRAFVKRSINRGHIHESGDSGLFMGVFRSQRS